jgi:heat shock 70kDa protein 4
MRSKLDERYTSYVQPDEKEKFLSMLSAAEDWLYSDEGEDATKSAYTAQLDKLHAMGDLIAFRYTEYSELPKAASLLREAINTYMTQTTAYFNGDEKYAHLEKKDVEGVVEKVALQQKWLDDMMVKQAEREKFKEPVVKSSEIKKRREELVYTASPVMNRPKPKPRVETPPPTQQNQNPPPPANGSGTQTPNNGTEQPADSNAAQEEAPGTGTGTPAEPGHMDVD